MMKEDTEHQENPLGEIYGDTTREFLISLEKRDFMEKDSGNLHSFIQ